MVERAQQSVGHAAHDGAGEAPASLRRHADERARLQTLGNRIRDALAVDDQGLDVDLGRMAIRDAGEVVGQLVLLVRERPAQHSELCAGA
jgi:hypothetical protein